MTLDTALLKASWRSWYASDMRVVGPPWLQLVWTFIFSTVIGVCFFVLGVGNFAFGTGRLPSWGGAGRWLMANLLMAWSIGACIHTLFAVLSPWVGLDRIRNFGPRGRALFFGGVPLLGVCIGWPLGGTLITLVTEGSRQPIFNPEAVIGALLVSVLISFLFYKHFEAKARQIEAEKRATEAQLRLLQAQIEPHFLFNTLANVQALIDHDAPRARQMLDRFTEYLRASLTEMRRAEASLDDELRLAEAYLLVQQTRMEERLRFRIEADAAARQVRLPPLLLQPLVENALHHGLEPQVEGGTVIISARIEGPSLILEVSDDGRGLAAAPRKGAGMALANVRERLATAFGNDGGLELIALERGTRARLRLPWVAADAPADKPGAQPLRS
ncbi:MAG: histidine kinase [Rubrivivax sp.]|nr:histidine kinase [Rubrivivax sp.]